MAFGGTKFLAIFLLADALFAGGSALASSPPYVPLGAMVLEAEAVAVVRIEKIDEIVRPRNLPSVWYPNRTITVRTVEVVRGKMPESFTIRGEVEAYKNSSAKVGAAALVFLSATKAGPDGDLPAFDAAQGFRVIADLVPKGDEKAQAAARDALVAAVKAAGPPLKPISQSGRLSNAKLSDAAMQPLLRLLESDDPLLRRWALITGLHYVDITPNLGERLIDLLEDEDPQVAGTAALTLCEKNCRSAETALRAYRKRIPTTDPFKNYSKEVRGTLQCWSVMKRLDGIPAALAEQVAVVVTNEYTRSHSISLELRLDKDKVQLAHRDRVEFFSDAILADLREQFADLPVTMEMLPFRVTLYVYRDNGIVTWGGQWDR